ncbi:MAG: hypothetical protein PHW34_14095 [Hespellia sp.]|nr:hypothetical protein [Hespellia sp.]
MQDDLREKAVVYLYKNEIKKGQLSEYLGISPQYLSDWLHKRVEFDDSKINQINEFIEK